MLIYFANQLHFHITVDKEKTITMHPFNTTNVHEIHYSSIYIYIYIVLVCNRQIVNYLQRLLLHKYYFEQILSSHILISVTIPPGKH